MNTGRDEDFDMPLLVQTSSSIASMSPRNNNTGGGFKGFHKNPKNSGNSNDANTNNIAAVSDEIEALSFPEHKQAGSDRTTNNRSPVSIVEHAPFLAQFDPDIIEIIEEKNDSATATVFDDNTSNDESVFTNNHEVESLKAPSIIIDDNDNDIEEKKDKDATAKSATNSISKNSKTSRKSEGGANSNSNKIQSFSSRKRPTCVDEDADAATWKADELDAFLGAIGFGECLGQPTMEISGVDLLTERDSSVNELLEANHLMTFNALVLIQKQKDWIEGSIDATNGADKGGRSLITMELQNLERKIRLLMDNKAWPNELERQKQAANPFTPSKAFFKAMALIDKSIEKFHKGYLKYMSKMSEENHELKARVAELVELNASLQDEATSSRQKTETIRNLQKERDDLTQMVDRTDDKLASLLVNDKRESIPNKKLSSKFHSVKSYIQRLETERIEHLTEIQILKKSGQNATESSSEINEEKNVDDIETAEGSSSCIADEDAEKTDILDNSSSVTTHGSDDDSKINDETGVLNDDLGSKWHTLEQNELAITSKTDQIKALSATVAGQESSLESIRAECKLMKMQLLELETTRKEYKSKCELKDSALIISQDRISSLEEEILRTYDQCATYEEDYDAMRESFVTQKVATKQELANSQDDVKAQVEQIRDEFKEKLKRSEVQLKEVKEDRERVVRDLKTSVEEIEAERDNLQARFAGNTNIRILPSPIDDIFKEEKKESDEDMYLVASPVVVSPKSSADTDSEQMHIRFAEKASKQAYAIAHLTEDNEIKDEQLKSLHEMLETLLGNKSGDGDQRDEDSGNRPWGKRISRLRAISQQRASGLLTRSRQGSFSGSRHGSRHGEE